MANEKTIDPERPNNSDKARRIKIGAFIVLIVAVAAIIYWWFFMRNYVTTDDAYAKADSAMLSVRVPGTILKVLVDNDFAVQTGQPLIELDPADYKVAVDKAKAELDADEAELKAPKYWCPRSISRHLPRWRPQRPHSRLPRIRKVKPGTMFEQLRNSRAATAADFVQAERDYKRFEALSASGAGTQRRQRTGTNCI